MDVGRVASLFISGLETFTSRNEMVFTLRFEEPFNGARLLSAFETLVRESPSLRLRFVEAQTSGGFRWDPISAADVEAFLARQRSGFETGSSLEACFDEYVRTGEGLPLRIHRVGTACVVLLVNHAFGNGVRALQLVEEWLRIYDGGSSVVPNKGQRSVGRRFPLIRFTEALVGVACVLAYVIDFSVRAGRRAAAETVDLSEGRAPSPGGGGYAIKTYLLTAEETDNAIENSRTRRLSVTQSLCAAMAKALFNSRPAVNRVCLSVPTELSAYVPDLPPDAPGNYTGSLIVQVRRNRPVDSQVRAAFQWTRHRVNYWLPFLLGALSTERKLRLGFARKAALPIPDRSPFENYSCAISSLGVLGGPKIRKYVSSLSAHGRMQTILLCAATLNGRMSVEVSCPMDLFKPAEVFRATDDAVAELTGGSVKHYSELRYPRC